MKGPPEELRAFFPWAKHHQETVCVGFNAKQLWELYEVLHPGLQPITVLRRHKIISYLYTHCQSYLFRDNQATFYIRCPVMNNGYEQLKRPTSVNANVLEARIRFKKKVDRMLKLVSN